jgi:hypothetical protein
VYVDTTPSIVDSQAALMGRSQLSLEQTSSAGDWQQALSEQYTVKYTGFRGLSYIVKARQLQAWPERRKARL